MINKVILIGNVGQIPEVRYTGDASNGAKVATIRLATTERYKDRNGNLQEHTEWHNVLVWRGSADYVEKYVKKGSQLYEEGRLRTRSWEDQTGAKRYTTDVMADTLQLLGRKQDSQDSGYSQPQGGYQQPAPQQAPAYQQPMPQQGYAPAAQPVQQSAPQQSFADSDPNDDLPF